MRLVLLRALNENQILILSSVNGMRNITSLLADVAGESGVPISTLKLNAKILKELGLIDFNGAPATVTELGRLIINILGER